MQKRKFAGKRAGGVSLPELLDELEVALTGTPARTSVCRALSDLSRWLSSANGKIAGLWCKLRARAKNGTFTITSSC
jgi:hypothetical protein